MVRRTKEDAAQTRQQIIVAARQVFHAHGVVRPSLEKIAKAAGVTRGAIYWHFRNKAELFFAVRDDAFVPMVGCTDAILFDPAWRNPLDAIEASTQAFFRALHETSAFREVFEIMIVRCEYVDEFADIEAEVARPALEFFKKIESLFLRAQETKHLRRGVSPVAAARSTWAFTSGLLHLFLGTSRGANISPEMAASMITDHIALFRCCAVDPGCRQDQ